MNHFQVGDLYDVGTSLGSYLLALGAAEPVVDETPARILPLDPQPERGGVPAPRPLRKR